jgi:arylsulfatase A-like enzyme
MPYEEATHVPLIVSPPGMRWPGRVDSDHLVSTGLDLIPTLCDFAGIPIPSQLPGQSIVPLVTQAESSGDWRESLVAENEGSRVLWSGQYKYAVYDHGQPREMLIDLEKDPGEMRNLAVETEYESELGRHRSLLQQWYVDYGQPLGGRFIITGK